MTAPEFVARVALPLVIVGSAVALLLLLDLILYCIGQASEGVRIDVGVWGTYAAWASAILPTIGIIATVGMWLVGREAVDIQNATDAMRHVVFKQNQDALPSIKVGSAGRPVEIVALSPGGVGFSGKIVLPDGPTVTLAPDTRNVVVRVLGYCFEISLDGQVARRLNG